MRPASPVRLASLPTATRVGIIAHAQTWKRLRVFPERRQAGGRAPGSTAALASSNSARPRCVPSLSNWVSVAQDAEYGKLTTRALQVLTSEQPVEAMVRLRAPTKFGSVRASRGRRRICSSVPVGTRWPRGMSAGRLDPQCQPLSRSSPRGRWQRRACTASALHAIARARSPLRPMPPLARHARSGQHP